MNDKNVVLKRMELARTGTFGANGSQITLQNLQDVVDTFDGKGPVSLGHYMTKQDWWPSWGNVETIEIIKDPDNVNAILYGDVSLHPVVADAIEKGFYPGWSVSIPERADGKRYLHHLALLGSVPPAIRDLNIIATVKPDNAIEAKGTAFADQAFYSFADFPEVKRKGVNMGGKTDDPKTPTTVAAPETTAAPETEFSDQLKKQEQKVKGMYKQGVRAKVIAEIGNRWPAGKQEELTQFADSLVESHDFDFSDEGTEGKVSLVDSFIQLIKSMSTAAPLKPGRMQEFSDAGTPAPKIDRGDLAKKF